MYFENTNFNLAESQTEIKFSFDIADADRKFIKCNFDSSWFANHNAFNSGVWTDCIFNGTLGITPKTANKMGDIQFNNCKFKDIVTIEIGISECYIQFNNCTFKGSRTFKKYGESNSEFNNCTFI